MSPLKLISSSNSSKFSLSLLPLMPLLASNSTRVESSPTMSAIAPQPLSKRSRLTRSLPLLVSVLPSKQIRSTPTVLDIGLCAPPMAQSGERTAMPAFASLATARLPMYSVPATSRPTPLFPILECSRPSRISPSAHEE
jgi:hypothetical protein